MTNELPEKPDDANPYAPPVASSQAADPVDPAEINPALVKKFRQQIHALGAFWIIVGLVTFCSTAVGIYYNAASATGVRVVLIVLNLLGLGLLILGVFTCLKQLWALYTGLVTSYLLVLASLLGFNICALVLLSLVILQAHRVLSWAKQMKAAGIPLG